MRNLNAEICAAVRRVYRNAGRPVEGMALLIVTDYEDRVQFATARNDAAGYITVAHMEHALATMKTELAAELQRLCRPGSPDYDRRFHAEMYAGTPAYFDGSDGLYPPIPGAESN